jgi:hypothetical protein
MSWQKSIQAAVRALRQEELTLQRQLGAIQTRIAELEGIEQNGDGAGRKLARRVAGTQRLSNAGREAISRAAKKRWAKYRAEQARKARRG